MFGVGNGITNNVFKEHLQNPSSYFGNKAWYTLHTTTMSETTNRWLSNALGVVSKDFVWRLVPPFPSPFPLPDICLLLWFVLHSLFYEVLPIELRMQNMQNACKTQRCEQLQYITYGGLLDNVEWNKSRKTYFPNLIVRSSFCFSHSTPCAFRPSCLPRAENHKQRRLYALVKYTAHSLK